jgi:hypothetical protein
VSVDALLFWLFVAAWVVLLGLVAFMALPRIAREGMRIVKRVLALVNQSSLRVEIARVQGDIARIRAARERLPGLERRAQAALVILRTVSVRLQREIRAFQSAR